MGVQTTVYKVVAKRDGTYSSASVADPKWVIGYKLGKTATANRGYIFAFDTYRNAQAWCDMCYAYDPQWRKHSILESEAVVVDREPMAMAEFLIDEYLTGFWDGKQSGHAPIPRGTVWCSELTPRRLYWEEE